MSRVETICNNNQEEETGRGKLTGTRTFKEFVESKNKMICDGKQKYGTYLKRDK